MKNNRMLDDYVWSLKYRPRLIKDIILPKRIKTKFQNLVKKKQLGNMLFTGRAGTGKTTLAFALANEFDTQALYIDLSTKTSINDIRDKVIKFASTSGAFIGGKKIIIGDECDRISPEAMDSLKSTIETYAKNTSFIFTTNNEHKLTEPMKSRLKLTNFDTHSGDETKDIKKQFFKVVIDILTENKVKFDKEAIKVILKAYYPDLRKCLNELQNLSEAGTIDMDAVSHLNLADLTNFYGMIKDKDFDSVKEFLVNLEVDYGVIFSTLIRDSQSLIGDKDFGTSIIKLAEYYDQYGRATDKFIPTLAMCVYFMSFEWR